MADPLLALHGLRIALDAPPTAYPVDGVDLELHSGQVLCLVGESGSGKSLTARSLLKLIPKGLSLQKGSLTFAGQELFAEPERVWRKIRGKRISMVFQDPQTHLNPVLTIGRQVTEPLVIHLGLNQRDAKHKAAELLATIGIPEPEARLRAYPDELSGGQRQRVMIAMALACGPEVLIADEPTTALDVTVQAQILALIQQEQQARGMAVLLITHDLDVAAHMADHIAVMYSGQIVEHGPAAAILATPRHPYTAGLKSCLPSLDSDRPLRPIPGQIPPLDAPPPGCRFAPRCPLAEPECARAPVTIQAGNGRAQRCLYPERVKEDIYG